MCSDMFKFGFLADELRRVNRSATSCKYRDEKQPMRAWEETKSRQSFISLNRRMRATCKHSNTASSFLARRVFFGILYPYLYRNSKIINKQGRLSGSTLYKIKNTFFPLTEQVKVCVISSFSCFDIFNVWILIFFKWWNQLNRLRRGSQL